MSKKFQLWAVRRPTGEIIQITVADDREKAIDYLCEDARFSRDMDKCDASWSEPERTAKKLGYRLVRVVAVESKP